MDTLLLGQELWLRQEWAQFDRGAGVSGQTSEEGACWKKRC